MNRIYFQDNFYNFLKKEEKLQFNKVNTKGMEKSSCREFHGEFPIAEWDHLLPQSKMTLNLLRASRINPKLSAYAMLEGQHDYNKVPLALSGAKVIVHAKPSQRKLWDYYGIL